ncbi:MAG: hypothetical protein JWL83_473 [Actinomycetia bacterium]|nr:hypothetical protein [Actinomycetes bacterium]
MADIEREVRERRRAGQIDDEYERELDRIFDAVAPPGAVGSGLGAALMRAERAAVIDPVGPVASRIPGVALLRRALRKLMAFYVEHVVRQVTAFGVMVVRAMRLLGERVDAVEARSPVTDPRLVNLALPVASDFDVAPWFDLVVKTLAPVSGRVLHAECGNGALLVALHDAGIDAYGIDPRPDAAAFADERRVEVRNAAVIDHLRAVPAGALGGMVVSGCAERLATGDIVELVDRAARVLAPGAPLVVLSRDPKGDLDPIAADLAPGRPLHPPTWAFLLARRGFELIETRTSDKRAPASYAVAGVRAGS